MGHKIHPRIHRTQIIYTWDSRWYSKKNYAEFLQQDVRIRDFLKEKFKDAHVDAVGIERTPKNIIVTIFAAKPGLIIGRGGQGLDGLRKEIERKFLQMKLKVKLNVQEISSPGLSAAILARTMAVDIEKRMAFRRVMKQGIERVIKAGAKGVKVSMSGRLNGAEIARQEKLASGKVPLITLRSDVDYAADEADTTYGKIGIKVWIYKGEVFGRRDIFATSSDANAKKEKSETKSDIQK